VFINKTAACRRKKSEGTAEGGRKDFPMEKNIIKGVARMRTEGYAVESREGQGLVVGLTLRKAQKRVVEALLADIRGNAVVGFRPIAQKSRKGGNRSDEKENVKKIDVEENCIQFPSERVVVSEFRFRRSLSQRKGGTDQKKRSQKLQEFR